MTRYSGILNSGVTDIAVQKSLGTNASRYSGIPPLYRTLQTVVAKPPRRAFGTEGAVHGDSAPVRPWRHHGIGSVKQQRETLKAAAATQSRSSSSKSARGGDFLQVESAGGENVTAPPPYSDLSEFFGPLKDVAQSAGNSEAGTELV